MPATKFNPKERLAAATEVVLEIALDGDLVGAGCANPVENLSDHDAHQADAYEWIKAEERLFWPLGCRFAHHPPPRNGPRWRCPKPHKRQ